MGARLLLASALVLAACTQTGNGSTPQAVEPGGVLRVAMVNDPSALMDPQREYNYPQWELFRCCLLRTLLSYDGHSGENGGSILRPDLATSRPDVSTDGLTWTFTLKTGISYAPPLQDTQIQAQDFVRALERTAKHGVYKSYYSSIEGFDLFASDDSATISGLRTPDPSTLVVTLSKPFGDLGYALALPTAAPIPADPADQGAEFGVATGHDTGYGSFLVASGPYMFAGSQALDPSVPPFAQQPVSGYVPGHSMVLVRNPSWHRSSDALRAAYPDEIDVAIGGSVTDAWNAVRNGSLDLVLDSNPTPQMLQSFETDPGLRRRTYENLAYNLEYLSMNLAIPPFDDPHVRRAVSFAIDKDQLVQAYGGVAFARPAMHLVPDDLEDGLLSDYDPYFSVGHHGDLARAKAEMRRSRYDSNGDGICDAVVCKGIRFPVHSSGPYSTFGDILKGELARIGIQLDPQPFGQSSYVQQLLDYNLHTPLGTFVWGSDFQSPSNFIEPLLKWAGVQNPLDNTSLVGAAPADLRHLNYQISHVPSLNAAIDACVGVTGDAAISCWTGIDTTAMEHVVPIVPLFFKTSVRTVSARVAAISWDQWTALPALDRIALTPGGPSAGVAPPTTPSASCGPSPIPAGTYVSRITKRDHPPAGAGGSFAVGTWTYQFGGADLAACLHASTVTAVTGGFKGFSDVLPYTIKGSEIIFGDTAGSCQGVFGIYRWRVRGNSLTFREVDDKQCEPRAFNLTAHPWIRQG